jgi:hypothetical protein
VNEFCEIDSFNSGQNDDYGFFVDIISSLTFAWPVHNHGTNRWRDRSVGAEEKEKPTVEQKKEVSS